MITEKEYKKLEREQKESGYAWKAVSQDGGVIYLDGADKRCSNWLRFVNCARGRCEENVLVRNIPGFWCSFLIRKLLAGNPATLGFEIELKTTHTYKLPKYTRS